MSTTPTPGRANLGTPVAEYVRMSTRGQFLSPANQSAAIAAYADANGMRVVQSYLDSGRSGLDVGGRPALQRLLSDVKTGVAEFQIVLVYDVSRWGRFQNADEAAFYEYLCMLSGVRVIYVAEPFSADNSPLAAVLKGLKRTMAAEFSRELSVKVFTGQARLVRMGFRQGSSPGYGVRRLLLDVAGHPKGRLEIGQRKSFTTDRVILTPGPTKEVRIVNRIFREYIDGLSQCEMARRLNSEKVPGVCGKRWSQQAVRSIVMNEKYIGNNIFARCSKRLRLPKVLKPENEWIRCNGAFKAIVPEAVFWKAQAEMNRRHHTPTDEEMLAPIRKLLRINRYLTVGMIESTPEAWSSHSYGRRFGNLKNVYDRVGYKPPRNLEYQNRRRAAAPWLASVVGVARTVIESVGAVTATEGATLTVDRSWSISFSIIAPR